MAAQPPKKDPSLKRLRRRLPYSPEPFRMRLQYLCDFLFAGDHKKMAAALNMFTHHLQKLLTSQARVTVSVAAHVVTRLNVRAEWFVCGTGAVFNTTPVLEGGLVLPKKLYTRRPVLDPLVYNFAPQYVSPPRCLERPTAAAPYREAARAVYAARADGRPVGFFLGGAELCDATRAAVKIFYDENYATFLVLTLAQLRAELARAYDTEDVLGFLYRAARSGLGTGDVVAKIAAKNPESLLYHCRLLSCPLFVSVEVGEIEAHFAPSLRGAELGAAVGAAAYVDLLAFVEHVRPLVEAPGGVFICAGEAERAARLLAHARQAASVSRSAFTFVVFGSLAPATQQQLQASGGNVICLDGPSPQTMKLFFRACDAAYVGRL